MGISHRQPVQVCDDDSDEDNRGSNASPHRSRDPAPILELSDIVEAVVAQSDNQPNIIDVENGSYDTVEPDVLSPVGADAAELPRAIAQANDVGHDGIALEEAESENVVNGVSSVSVALAGDSEQKQDEAASSSRIRSNRGNASESNSRKPKRRRPRRGDVPDVIVLSDSGAVSRGPNSPSSVIIDRIETVTGVNQPVSF